jgi:GT2 family glycosyltransferase
MKVTVIITSFNRRDITLACLTRLYEQTIPSEITLEVILFDDGSTDGTIKEVANRFPRVIALQGTGSDYWATSVRHVLRWIAQEPQGQQPGLVLLLNDDMTLYPDALEKLLGCSARRNHKAIVGGAVEIATGGIEASARVWKRTSLRPRQLPLSENEQECDAVPGHAMLFPYSLLAECRFYGENLTHGFFDTVLCARAKRLGANVVMVPGALGSVAETHQYRQDAMKFVNKTPLLWHGFRYHPKAPPIHEMVHYLRTVGGPWPLRLILIYRWHIAAVARKLLKAR